jgi:hypothetical protein
MYWRSYFKDQNTAWIADLSGNHNLYKSSNAGSNWVLVSSNPNIEISRFQFLNENTGINVVSNAFYKTTNGGINWNLHILPLYSLFGAPSFINENTGWIVGSYGYIIKTTTGGTIGIQPVTNEIPQSFMLYQNYPNPFNPVTKIKFNIPPVGDAYMRPVQIKIYDILGRDITTLFNEELKPGTYEIEWNASGFSSGVYFYRLEAGEFSVTKKMVLLK